MVAPQPYGVEVEDAYGNVLDLSDGDTYVTNTSGLHDYPTVQPDISQGYMLGGYLVDVTYLPRQFSMSVNIVAGRDQRPKRNAAHNAARDALISMCRRGKLLKVRTMYLGYDDPFEIRAVVQTAPWEVGTSTYTISLIAPDPTLLNTLAQSQTHNLPFGGQPEKEFTVTVGGNVEARPVIDILATANKTDRWNYKRTYQIENPLAVRLTQYPVELPFDVGAAITAGKLKANAGDLRVKAGGAFVDRWLFGDPSVGDRMWVALDIGPLETVSVDLIYGYVTLPDGQDWQNRTDGPIFAGGLSDNAQWRYQGAFMDAPGLPTTRIAQWNPHYRVALGMVSINRHLDSPPWLAVSGDTSSVNAAGGEIPYDAQIQGYSGTALHHPLGIIGVTHSGRTHLDPAKVKLVLRRRDPHDGAIYDVWQLTSDTSAAEAAYGPEEIGFSTGKCEAVVLALRSLTVHTDVSGRVGGADDVTIDIEHPVVVTGGAETDTYMLEFTLENLTTGQLLTLFGTLEGSGPPYPAVVLNLSGPTPVLTANGQPFYYALQLGEPIRANWFELIPGDNIIRIRDEAVEGLQVLLSWHDRRM